MSCPFVPPPGKVEILLSMARRLQVVHSDVVSRCHERVSSLLEVELVLPESLGGGFWRLDLVSRDLVLLEDLVLDEPCTALNLSDGFYSLCLEFFQCGNRLGMSSCCCFSGKNAHAKTTSLFFSIVFFSCSGAAISSFVSRGAGSTSGTGSMSS